MKYCLQKLYILDKFVPCCQKATPPLVFLLYFLVPSSIVQLKNMTVVKGKTVTLLCDVSGRPEPSISWTHVRTGKKQLNKTWILTDFQQSDIGEYRCDASNIFGNDSKSTFISLHVVGKCKIPNNILQVFWCVTFPYQ